MNRLVKRVLSTEDLPLAELTAARLDGELYGVDLCFAPVDEVPSRIQRADAVHRIAPRSVWAELATAAWVHGVGFNAPCPHTFAIDIEHRTGMVVSSAMSVRERRVSPLALTRIGPLAVTTPFQTAVDFLRGTAFGDEEGVLVAGLLAVAGSSPGECAHELARRRTVPGNRRALQRLSTLEDAQPALTR
jgi:hypothetical protein